MTDPQTQESIAVSGSGSPAAPGDSSLGSSVGWPVRRAWWAVQERVLWRGADAGRAFMDDLRWPFERTAWAVRRGIVWPLGDAFAERGALGRSGIAATLLIAAAGASFGGVQLADTGGSSGPLPVAAAVATSTPAPVPPPAPLPIPEPRPEPVEEVPVLQGVTPTFEPAPAPADTERPADDADAGPASDDEPDASAAGGPVAADTSAPAQATREPLAVARRFARAFVAYEIGQSVAEARTVFRETAAPPLAKALADRPPRQPAAVKVPKAKVLNLVPGPRRRALLPVSVSLLRLGVTSELRLDLERNDDGEWLVGDVRG